ncbi:hypothetical protein K523DRAFT_368757 [Schizophyllum commune Tattone D]|nr:hypothetical protein K523DRAFT_368757 [Schizophyllum commune Tattone D]
MPPKKRSRKYPAQRQPTTTAVAPPTKARVVANGKLKLLVEMPLDILYEIFGHLDPQSLLHVSYTSKALRAILITRNSRSVWRKCISADADFPPKPDNLNEPQWTEVLLGNTCSYCNRPSSCALWPFSVRTCDRCLGQRFFDEASIIRATKEPVEQCRLHLHIHAYAHYRRVYNLTDVKAAIELFKGVDQADADAVKAVQSPLLERQMAAEMHARKCENYVNIVLPRRQREEERRFLKARLAQIEIHLRALGFSEEIDWIHSVQSKLLEDHPLIKSFDEITDSSWTQISRPLSKLLSDIRDDMLEKKRKKLLKDRMRIVIDALKAYVSSKPVPSAIDDADQVYPSALDIISLPSIRCMMFAEVKSYVTDVEPDLKRLKSSLSLDALDALCDEWRTLKGRELVAMLPDAYRHLEDEEDDELYSLRFACVFFRCAGCNEPVNFPRVLAHSCAREARLGFRNLAGEEAWLWKRLDALPWNHDGARVEWDGQVARAAMSVIRACGCDPRIVDQGDMDEEAAWLACASCEGQTGGKEREVFGWRRAIVHHLGHLNRGEDDPSWIHLLDEEDIRLAKRAEAHCRSRNDMEARTDAPLDYACVHCRERMSLSVVKHHFLHMHNKSAPVEGDDYRLHVDASMRGLRLHFMIPRRGDKASKPTATKGKRKGKAKAQAAEVIEIED